MTGWQEVMDINEIHSDITPTCGNSDLITDDDGGDFAYYNIIDPTPATPTNGDEYILFRLRLAQSPNGNFGYNFLVDTDAKYGAGVDPNSICGNPGFEREIQYANAGGKKGVSVYNVDGVTNVNNIVCSQCTSVSDVQQARAASAGGCASSPTPHFVTFPLLLSYLGVPSNIDPLDFFISAATASSGNGTSVLGGGNVTDLGGLDKGQPACGCAGQSGCDLFDCQIGCLNTAFVALPVTFNYFTAEAGAHDVYLRWATATESNNSHFDLEHSTDGVSFTPLSRIFGVGTSTKTTEYDFVHRFPPAGTHYYRLRQEDLDGTYRYSSIEAVSFGAAPEEAFAIVPTIVINGSLRIERFADDTDGPVELTVFDAVGRRLLQRRVAGSRAISLDVAGLRPGNYFLQLRDGSTLATKRFVKQ
ncbi:hypothetical protein GGR26_002938 [Lewinella marina]|uniref:T9SS type A sorting domain-containing protein n=1 Tax=Neolewinella marina TaxID=438751 RepID=UPI001431C866|nr:T9SS type A sorting domain-containing protein [Neolewinella marina]NJB87161.1 hypothetical protein [Neolewinella marina]